jgi:hypothetical protein
MFSKNVETLVRHLVKDGVLVLDLDDEITKAMVVTAGAEGRASSVEGAATG